MYFTLDLRSLGFVAECFGLPGYLSRKQRGSLVLAVRSLAQHGSTAAVPLLKPNSLHTADADETKLSSRVASAVCTRIRN